MAKPTADAHKHISMCINTLVHLYHDNRYNHRQTGCGDTLCVIKFQTSSGPVAENPHRHVILRACVSNSLFKVNKDLDFLKSILISGSRSCLGSEAVCLSWYGALPLTNTDFGRLWWKIRGNVSNGSLLCCLVNKKKNNAVLKGLFKVCLFKILEIRRSFLAEDSQINRSGCNSCRKLPQISSLLSPGLWCARVHCSWCLVFYPDGEGLYFDWELTVPLRWMGQEAVEIPKILRTAFKMNKEPIR